MTIQFKNFRSPGEDIRVSSLSGHVAIISKEFSPVPSFMWGDAYSLGAISEDMVSKDMDTFIANKKAEQDEAAKKERDIVKEILRTALENPISYLDKHNNLIHRKAIALIGMPIKKDILDSIWNELLEETKV